MNTHKPKMYSFTNAEIKQMQDDVLNFRFSNVRHKEVWIRAFECRFGLGIVGGVFLHRNNYRKALLYIKAKRQGIK